MTVKKGEKCLTPKCGRFVSGRGICAACHYAASNLVKSQQATWEELEALGLCLPKKGTLFTKAFLEAKAKKQADDKPDSDK